MSDDVNSKRTEPEHPPSDDTSIDPLDTPGSDQSDDQNQLEIQETDNWATTHAPESDKTPLPTNAWWPTVPRSKDDSPLQAKDPMHLAIGELYGDFFITGELGRGSFGAVYQAEQISLKRTVALKVSDATQDDGCSFEGQTMAQLEHPSIVQVYLQSTDEVNNRRLLCMQYIAGINLRTLIRVTRDRFGENWIGKNLLQILDRSGRQEDVVLRETSMADRAVLEDANQLATICWMGAQSAYALSHAHCAGYIHRDVKPENTIINRFGRPMLVDFNLAIESEPDEQRGVVGGTIPYMSPESIRAFANHELSKTTNPFADDVYALGVMLWELASGKFPFASGNSKMIGDEEAIQRLIESRKIQPENGSINPRLADILRRAIHHDPNQRFESAKMFAESLEGVNRQTDAIEARSINNWLARSVVKHPVWWLLIAGFGPHFVATALQITYNQSEIIGRLNTSSQRELFFMLVYWVNPIIYGICGFFVANHLFAVLRPWLKMRRGESVPELKIENAREKSLAMPQYLAIVGGLGWLGGALAFPALLYIGSVRFTGEVWIHFIVSFVFSGAIAVTFSFALTLAVVIYGMYPTMFVDPARFSDKAMRQLGPFRAKWTTLSVFAGGIPLAATILLVANFHPTAESFQEFAFKSLVIGLICSSAFGFELVRRVGRAVIRLIDRCTRPTSR